MITVWQVQLATGNQKYLLTRCYKNPVHLYRHVKADCSVWRTEMKSDVLQVGCTRRKCQIGKFVFEAVFLRVSSFQLSVLVCHCPQGLQWFGSASVMSFLVLDFILDLVLCRTQIKKLEWSFSRCFLCMKRYNTY